MTQEVTVKREGDTALLVDENGATFLELTPNQNDMLGLTWQTLRNLNHEKAAHDLLRVMDDIKTRPGVMPMVTTAAKERDGRPRCVHVERDNMGVRIITDHRGWKWLMNDMRAVYGRDEIGWFRVAPMGDGERVGVRMDARRLPD